MADEKSYGWAGKILRVNLTTGSITTESTAPYKEYIGGMGLANKIMYDEVPAGTDPLSEESKIVYAVGPLTASGVPLAEHTTEQFDLALYSGLYPAFYYMKACYPYLAKSKGSVINFASGAGLFGNFGQCSYAAAKEGIRGLSRVAATEWGKDGINVNVICPLAWTAKLEQFQQAYPDAFKANVKMPPMGHYANPETEIGRVCVQLAMPDFKYLSGETLTLEGGMGLRP